MSDCQNCDGRGLCLNCRHVGGCGECSYTGACPECNDPLLAMTQREADSIGTPCLLITDGGEYVLKPLRHYVWRRDGGRILPTIERAAWPSWWEYGGGA